MADHRALADRVADVALSQPEQIAKGFFGYQRYRLTLQGAEQTREVVRAGKVAAVLPLDLERGEIVLIRQFRLPAHLANGHGELVEIVAGRSRRASSRRILRGANAQRRSASRPRRWSNCSAISLRPA